ncbi:hypothetical protein NIES4075_47900 [Tolypothrix sp. NIES-4075]|uniref:hypothetical protein n=1 Tax=Tolypothrix sp. NIES-4075 TaxID=2005459 RepID=UPI000B5CB10F|nr:hypothetical protein [Tolypothrix sp. NIES-4075]GAX43775.1 hypothetical protein NIES4075_47900 [Tolypothrix sp. NIES-4075]
MTDFLSSLLSGDINLITSLVWLAIAAGLSIVGGAIGGVLLAGKDLGYELAAMTGGLLGPAGVIPTIFLGLLILNLLNNS